MAAYEALYRKWRPQTFEDIVAQPHITRTLKNQVMRGKTAHAYLFTGSRGTGKTTCARIFAKAVNCLHPVDGNPCLECEICRDAEAGALTDIIEIDGASNNGVDEVRNLRENAVFLPVRCRYKVYIIDEVHMMSAGAFNALLKLIEEPPEHVKFVFATTEIHKVPATILSRCQRYDFRRILPEDIVARMQFIASQEVFTLSDTAAYRIAALADGGMRDALSLLDQCAAVADQVEAETVEETVGVAGLESVYAVLRAIAAKDTTAALSQVATLYRQSKDMTRFSDEISQQLRAIMLLKTSPQDTAQLHMMPDDLAQLQAIAEQFTLGHTLEALDTVRQCCDRMSRSSNRRIELEMTLIRLCNAVPANDSALDALTAKVAELEAQLRNVMQNGVQVRQKPPARSTQTHEALASNLQVTAKTDTSEFVLLTNWATILERFETVNPSVSGLLQGSSAYVSDEKRMLLMIVTNRLFRRLFSKSDADTLAQTVEQVLGKRYSIRFKCMESEDERISPAEQILQRAKDNGMDATTSDDHPI